MSINHNKQSFSFADAPGLEEKVRVVGMQTRILECLQTHMANKYPMDGTRCGKLLMYIPYLRKVSSKAAERFLSLTFEGSIEINSLVLEMLN